MADPCPGVSAFLSSLDHDQRERFLAEAESRDSTIQLWLYACALGYEGDFLELERWQAQRYPRLNRRVALTSEAVRLERDIADLRGSSSADPRCVAALTKELRGTLVEIERMEQRLDRRGLLLTGADRLLRILQDAFPEDEEMGRVLEESYETFLAQLEER